MATGSSLGGLLVALLPLIGVASILRARSRSKAGRDLPVDEVFEQRQAATRDTERRMAAYLAQRDQHRYDTGEDRNEQETGR